jgi:hypothetical protein
MGNKGVCALYEEEVNVPNPEPYQPAQPVQTVGNRIDYDDKSYYVGDIDNAEPNGNGTYTKPDGTYYKGEWKDGLPHGKGEETLPGTTIT